MIPDVEKIASDWLRGYPGFGERVVGRPPESKATPWVQVLRLNATPEPNSRPDHLNAFLLQLDCYAGAVGGQPEANRIGREVRAALTEMAERTIDGAVIGAVKIVGDSRIPDHDIEQSRERVILTARIWAHS